LQQVRINEHTQLGAVTEGGNAVIGLGNLSRNAQTSLDIF
jgi:lipid-binding SYLF domain-containing protein